LLEAAIAGAAKPAAAVPSESNADQKEDGEEEQEEEKLLLEEKKEVMVITIEEVNVRRRWAKFAYALAKRMKHDRSRLQKLEPQIKHAIQLALKGKPEMDKKHKLTSTVNNIIFRIRNYWEKAIALDKDEVLKLKWKLAEHLTEEEAEEKLAEYKAELKSHKQARKDVAVGGAGVGEVRVTRSSVKAGKAASSAAVAAVEEEGEGGGGAVSGKKRSAPSAGNTLEVASDDDDDADYIVGGAAAAPPSTKRQKLADGSAAMRVWSDDTLGNRDKLMGIMREVRSANDEGHRQIVSSFLTELGLEAVVKLVMCLVPEVEFSDRAASATECSGDEADGGSSSKRSLEDDDEDM